MLHHGLYEQVINNALTSEFAEDGEADLPPVDQSMYP